MNRLEHIRDTTAGDPCTYCGMHVWYDDELPGYFSPRSRNTDGELDVYFCAMAPSFPNRYTSTHDVTGEE